MTSGECREKEKTKDNAESQRTLRSAEKKKIEAEKQKRTGLSGLPQNGENAKDWPLQESHVKYYMIGEVETTDQNWVPDYVKNVTGMVERWGGRYLARTPKAEKVEGERKPQGIMVIVEWPSKEAAVAFYESEEYRPFRQKRLAGAKNEFLLVAGEDVARTARIPE